MIMTAAAVIAGGSLRYSRRYHCWHRWEVVVSVLQRSILICSLVAWMVEDLRRRAWRRPPLRRVDNKSLIYSLATGIVRVDGLAHLLLRPQLTLCPVLSLLGSCDDMKHHIRRVKGLPERIGILSKYRISDIVD